MDNIILKFAKQSQDVSRIKVLLREYYYELTSEQIEHICSYLNQLIIQKNKDGEFIHGIILQIRPFNMKQTNERVSYYIMCSDCMFFMEISRNANANIYAPCYCPNCKHMNIEKCNIMLKSQFSRTFSSIPEKKKCCIVS